MIKFESYQEIDNNNNKIDIANDDKKNRLVLCLHCYDYTLLIWKRSLKWLAIALFVINH